MYVCVYILRTYIFIYIYVYISYTHTCIHDMYTFSHTHTRTHRSFSTPFNSLSPPPDGRIQGEPVLEDTHIFVCVHASRDVRCGNLGPLLVDSIHTEIQVSRSLSCACSLSIGMSACIHAYIHACMHTHGNPETGQGGCGGRTARQDGAGIWCVTSRHRF
jgi:hypothetical protein